MLLREIFSESAAVTPYSPCRAVCGRHRGFHHSDGGFLAPAACCGDIARQHGNPPACRVRCNLDTAPDSIFTIRRDGTGGGTAGAAEYGAGAGGTVCFRYAGCADPDSEPGCPA